MYNFCPQVVGEVGACMPIVGLFKECDDVESKEDIDRLIPKEKGKKMCYKKRYCYLSSSLAKLGRISPLKTGFESCTWIPNTTEMTDRFWAPIL